MLRQKNFWTLFFLGLCFLELGAQRIQQYIYIAPYFGVSRFTGEFENNQLLSWCPVGPMSRPTAGVVLGSRFNESVSIEVCTDLSFYGGDSRYSDPNIYSNGTVKGSSFMLGFAFDKKFKNRYDLGIGFNHNLNQFSEKVSGQNDWQSYNTQNNSIMFRLSKCIKHFENGNEILFRYSIVYNFKDNWDSHQYGEFNDYLSIGQLVFILPTQNISSRNSPGTMGVRSKNACPEF
jgi:hypothetical protein